MQQEEQRLKAEKEVVVGEILSDHVNGTDICNSSAAPTWV